MYDMFEQWSVVVVLMVCVVMLSVVKKKASNMMYVHSVGLVLPMCVVLAQCV